METATGHDDSDGPVGSFTKWVREIESRMTPKERAELEAWRERFRRLYNDPDAR